MSNDLGKTGLGETAVTGNQLKHGKISRMQTKDAQSYYIVLSCRC